MRAVRPRLVSALALAGLLFGVMGLFAAQLAVERQQELSRASRGLSNLAAVIAEHARQVFESVDAELLTLAGEVDASAGFSGGVDAAQATLRRALASTPVVDEFYLVDADGRVVAASSPLPSDTPLLAESESFRHHAAVASSDAYIAEPGLGSVGAARGRHVVRISRRVSSPSGQLLGIVVADMSVEPFRALYTTVELGVSGVVTLFRNDGLVLVREPAGGRFGSSIANTPFFAEQIRDNTSGVFDLVSPLDGVVRMSAFDRDGRRRIFVTVGIARDEVLQAWTRRAWMAMAGAALLVSLVAVTLGYRVRVARDDEQAARASATRFRRLADASSEISRAPTVAVLLDRVAEAAREVVPAHQALVRLSPGPTLGAAIERLALSDEYASRWTDSRRPDDLAMSRIVCDQNIALRLTKTDLDAHPAWRGVGTNPEHHTSVRGWLAVPLVARDGTNLGLLQLSDRADGEFSDEDQAMLEQLARLTASSLETRQMSDAAASALSAAESARGAAEDGRRELERVFNTTSDAFYALDEEWRFTFFNTQAEQILDIRRDAVMGRRVWDVFPRIVDTQIDIEYRLAMADGLPREFRYFAERLELWLDVRVFPHDAGLSVYFRDVTERLALDAQVQQVQKMDAVGQLTGGVAHDFNNLLTIILGSTDNLIDELHDNESLRSLAEMTRSAAEKGAELTQRLLAFSRRQPLQPRAVDVGDLLIRLDALMRPTLGEHIDVHLGRGDGLWPAMVDPSQLETAILNLAINARDAMPDGGRLSIEATNVSTDAEHAGPHGDLHPGHYVRVAVSDSGTGMPPEVVARAFEPFFTTKDVGRGSGLGLSMVYGFAKQSDGHVLIDSEPGRGTTVNVYLPRAAHAQLPEPVVEEAQVAPRGTEIIGVVEDQEGVRRYTEDLLRGLGYAVVSFESGPELLAALAAGFVPNLLLSDVVLPAGMNGRQVADAARQIIPGLKVLYMSGYSEDAVVHHGRLDEGVQLLGKPFRKTELAVKVRAVLDEARDKPPPV